MLWQFGSSLYKVLDMTTIMNSHFCETFISNEGIGGSRHSAAFNGKITYTVEPGTSPASVKEVQRVKGRCQKHSAAPNVVGYVTILVILIF